MLNVRITYSGRQMSCLYGFLSNDFKCSQFTFKHGSLIIIVFPSKCMYRGFNSINGNIFIFGQVNKISKICFAGFHIYICSSNHIFSSWKLLTGHSIFCCWPILQNHLRTLLCRPQVRPLPHGCACNTTVGVSSV